MGCGGGGCGGGSYTLSEVIRRAVRLEKADCNRDVLAVDNPNFSVVVRGGCNARCPFCFSNNSIVEHPDYINILKGVLENFPKEFQQVSITGGEPTISPDIRQVLELLKPRFKKVVFNTNGHALYGLLDDSRFNEAVTHVNISRHAVDGDENNKIMGINAGSGVPDEKELTLYIEKLNMYGIYTCLNAVVDDTSTEGFVHDYIKLAKRVGASAVSFRKKVDAVSDMKPVQVEKAFDKYRHVGHNECPACRDTAQIIDGMMTVWKVGLWEPMDKIQLIYELIFQKNGKLTMDWAGRHEIKLKRGRLITPKMIEIHKLGKEMECLKKRLDELQKEQSRLKQLSRLVSDPVAMAEKL